METETRKEEEEEKKKMAAEKWRNGLKCPHIASFILLAIVAVSTFHLTRNNCNVVSVENLLLLKQEQKTVSKNGTISGCNLFSGRWVYDDVSYPIYKEKQCSFIEHDFACGENGRKEFKYQNWRWQPHQCNMPRFNGTALMEKLRGKKVIFVGDSLGRNQWESLLCLIEPYLPPASNKQLKANGNFYTFRSIEYNATIEFYWAPMLVESNCDNLKIHRARPRIIRIKSIEKHGRQWNDADILVFDSYAWWTDPTMTVLWGSFDSPDAIQKEVGMKLRRYEIVLNTLSDWLEMHINRNKTKIFFMSSSPYSSGHTVWGTNDCYNQTEPILDETYWPSGVNRSMMQIPEKIIEKLEQRGLKIEYLNVTQLSGYREDAHPSIYRTFWGQSKEQIVRERALFSDCMHWCLPGVPDVWNQILYAYIMKS